MKILHVVSTLSPRAGGLPRAVLSIAAAQARAGHRPAIQYGILQRPESGRAGAWEDRPGLDSTQFFPVRPWETLLSNTIQAWSPDAVHIHGLWEPLLHRMLHEASCASVPTVLTPHGMSSPWQDARYRRVKGILKRFGGYTRRWRRADCLQALSPHEAAHWQTQGFDTVRMVPNAFFPDEVPSTPTEPFEKGPPPGAPYLLFLGRLSPQKAPEKIVKAFMEVADRFPELHLVLAGPDYGLRPLLCRMISASPLATRIWMPGMLSDAQKWPALKHASLMVLPSRNEGHSLSLLEAAAAGCPSLISRAAGFEELVDAGGAWFFDGSVADLTDKLRQRLVDREQLSEAGQSAQEFVSRRYTWEVRLPEWMSLYGPAT